MLEREDAARGRKVIWLGILAFWILLGTIPMIVLRFSRPLQRGLPLWFAYYSGIFAMGLLFLGIVVGTIVFIVDAARNRHLTTISKSLWIAGILVVGPVLFPFYWGIHVLRAPGHG